MSLGALITATIKQQEAEKAAIEKYNTSSPKIVSFEVARVGNGFMEVVALDEDGQLWGIDLEGTEFDPWVPFPLLPKRNAKPSPRNDSGRIVSKKPYVPKQPRPIDP
jgi:hypothetical protein